MLTVIETPEFIAWSAKVWSDAERMEFIDWISENPEAGDVIPGSGSLRKVRWVRAGMGKRGGARVSTSSVQHATKWSWSWSTPRPSSTTSAPMC
jgi:hypothetical protein